LKINAGLPKKNVEIQLKAADMKFENLVAPFSYPAANTVKQMQGSGKHYRQISSALTIIVTGAVITARHM